MFIGNNGVKNRDLWSEGRAFYDFMKLCETYNCTKYTYTSQFSNNLKTQTLGYVLMYTYLANNVFRFAFYVDYNNYLDTYAGLLKLFINSIFRITQISNLNC